MKEPESVTIITNDKDQIKKNMDENPKSQLYSDCVCIVCINNETNCISSCVDHILSCCGSFFTCILSKCCECIK